jgi:polyhydroxyalkanoate synthesis regulator phasin
MSERSGAGATNLRDVLERVLEIGLGAALLTREAATKFVDDMVKRGSMTREEGKHLFDEMMEKGKQQKQRMDELVAEMVERVLARSDLARRSQLEALEKRLEALEAHLRAHAEKHGPPWEGPGEGPTPV